MRYVYPPRPKSKMHPNDLARMEKVGGWLAQYKYKGSRVVVAISNGKIELRNRHGSHHTKFFVNQDLHNQIMSLNLDPTKEYLLDGELMDHFTKDIKGTIVFYDVLWAGRYLFGVNQLDRLALLSEICRHPTQMESKDRALEVTTNVWMAETFDRNFVHRFNFAAQFQELEGLVLRKAKASLDNTGNAEYETPNVLRCRKPDFHGSF